ncbi:MAG: hypothetical protein IRZ11_02435, partial [Clostridia bacterium]|nr:hypothetical protein [Clostridia bacterium]
MALLLDWARTLSLTLVFAGLAELLCPDGALKREARIGVGLVVLAVLLAPLLDVRPGSFAGEVGSLWQAVAPAPPVAAPAGPASPPGPSEAVGFAPQGPGGPGAPGPPASSGGASEFVAAWRAAYLAMLDERLAALAETVPGVRSARVAARLGEGPGWGR